MSVETLTKLLYCSFPVIVIVTVIIYVIVNSKKRKDRGEIDTTPPQFYGMRTPTDEEAAGAKKRQGLNHIQSDYDSACRHYRWQCLQHLR